MRIRNTPDQTSTARRSGRRWFISAGVLLAATGVFALSACAASTASSDSAPAATSAAGASGEGLPGGGGISGEIAAITGTTLQVQDTDSQTAVTYSDATAITRTVTATLSDVTAGVCVSTLSGFGGAAVSGSTDSGSDSDAADAASTAATSVTISTPTDGACTSGFAGAAGGTPPTDFPSTMPTDIPDGVAPTGAPDGSTAPGDGGFGGFTNGLVTAVSGTTITVETTSSDGTTSTADVAVDDSTTYSTIQTADASALVVGACVLVQGESDSSGTVAATTLAVSDAGDSGCSTGFGAGMGGPGGAGGQRPGGTGTSGSGTSTSGS